MKRKKLKKLSPKLEKRLKKALRDLKLSRAPDGKEVEFVCPGCGQVFVMGNGKVRQMMRVELLMPGGFRKYMDFGADGVHYGDKIHVPPYVPSGSVVQTATEYELNHAELTFEFNGEFNKAEMPVFELVSAFR